MNKPSGYDKSPATMGGQFDRPAAGAYVCKILGAKEEQTKEKQRPMLVIFLDIATGEHAGHFKKLFDFLKSRNAEAKWPCVYRRCMDGEQLPYFKGDIKTIEDSNAGFKFNFDEGTLKGKNVGCMLGEKEIDSTGKTILEPRFLCTVEKVNQGGMKAPAAKKYEGSYNAGGISPDADAAFPMDEPLPFN